MLRFYRGSIRFRQFISKSFVRKSGGAKFLLGMWTSVFNMVSKLHNLGGIQKEVPQIWPLRDLNVNSRSTEESSKVDINSVERVFWI